MPKNALLTLSFMETERNGPILRQIIYTQKYTAGPIVHGNYRQRPDFTAKHLSAQKGAVDPVVHASVREPKNAPLIQPFMETRGNDQILGQSI